MSEALFRLQALDVPIALLERRAALEAARQHYPSEAGPTDADLLVEAQASLWPAPAARSCAHAAGSRRRQFKAAVS